MDFGQPDAPDHNYVRHGILDLFAALNVATGEVIARCKPQYRAQDFVAFLREIESHVEPVLDITSSSTISLRAAILAYVDAHNDRDTPFKWIKAADEVLDSMRRFGLRLQQVHGQ